MLKVENILTQEMNRRQFLGVIGLGIITLLGIPTLLGVLSPDKKQENANIASGYGASNYGM
jgi:hypothetical protein